MRERLKKRKYLAGIMLVFVVATLVGLLKFGTFDKLKGQIKIKDFYLSNISTKLNGNVLDAAGEGPVVSKGFDEVSYELKYRLSNSNQRRDVTIVGTLDSDNGYASFKRLTGDNITSTLSNDNRRIEIVIRDVEADTEITTNIPLTINGAPNGYKINPTFKIKESTSEDFINVYTNPIEVSTNNLRGTVRDVDGNTISDIIISAYKNKKLIRETYTNQNGEYILSDLPEDNYIIKINEDIYKEIAENNVVVSGDTKLDLTAERVYPFTLEVHKYITKVDAINLNTPILRTYDNASMVVFPVNKLTNLSGKVYYSIVVENTGEKEGIVSVVKDELPDYMSFDKKLNDGFELKDGIIYDRNLEGKVLKPGEKIIDTLVLNIENTNEARTYLNRVNSLGELYEHVVYVLDGKTYKEEDVLEGEKIIKPSDPVDEFGGWYTDSEYTNLYNFNNVVTKDLILYGKTGQKYKVEFYDKDPEDGDEILYTKKEVPSGDPVDEPSNHPNHTGYDFTYWCKVDNTKYIFSTPVTSDLKLISCYKIKKYDVNFYNYQDVKEKTIKVEYKKLIDQTLAPTFDETGFTFICWSKDKTNCFDFTTPVTENIDLYPIHQKLTNAVIFNDENRITTKEVDYGLTVDPVDDQGKEGHTFRCWSEDRENCFDFNTPIIKNTTVYAEYDINKYTVNFIDRDPETSVETPYGESQIVNWGSKATRPETDPSHTGYTFNEWTKTDGTTYNFDTPVKENITLISKYTINTYPVRFHNDNDVTTVNVEYKHKVTPITSPTKDHHLFKNWLDEEDLVFDFDTLIVEERDLYSSFEEILPPSISHTPTMWTNQNVTVTLDKNENLVDDTGYSYLYKTTESNYSSYTDPFVISENTTIIAKGVKEEVDSVVENHQIVNIDKLNPSITLFSENSVNRTSVVLNVNALDNESGINYYEVYQDDVKVGEKHLECYDETTFEGYESCRINLPTERETTYTITGLNHSTTYRFKVKVYDKAGNSVMSDEIEVTTTTPRIVARLIGYNNSLFTDTVDETTGEVIVPKEDKYINFESLEEAFDYEDLYDCKNVQCTIQMVTGTNESVEVLEGQNLTLDLNGQIVSGVNSEYTIKNNGSFTLIESQPETEDTGKIVNNLGVGILNKADAHLTLGEGYSDRQVAGSTVSVTRPYVYGETVGIKNESNGYFTMFDGKIVSPVSQTPGYGAVNGRVTGTEYSYTSISSVDTIDARNYQVVTLSVLVSPEARVNQSVYYSKLSSAMNSVNIGTTTFEDDDTPRRLMQDLKSTGKYGFMYNEDNGTWTSYTEGDTAEANAYLIIDLTNEANNKSLNINYSVDTNYTYLTSFLDINSNTKPANITVNEYISNNNLGDSVSSYKHTETEYGFELEKGKVYIVNIAHAKYDENQIGAMTINDISLSDIETNHNKISTTSDISLSSYGFYYDERDRKIKSNNQYNSEASTALGFVEIDLTDKEGEYDLVVDAAMESYALNMNWQDSIHSNGKVWVGENKSELNSLGTFFSTEGSRFYKKDVDVYDPVDYNNGIFGGYSTYGPFSYVITLTGGKKYYLGFRYEKIIPNEELFPSREEFENANCSDQLMINSIDLIKKSNSSTNLNVFNTEIKNDNIISELVENSNGGLILDGSKYRTNNIQTNQEMNTSATIDLTNSNKGEMLVVDLTHLSGSNSSDISISSSYYTDCTNCFSVFQKRIENGEEVKYYVGYGPTFGYNNRYDSTTGLTKTRYLFPLAGGYEYEIRFNTISPDTSMANFPNVRIENIRTEDLTNVEGNYFNSITGDIDNWFDGNYSDELSLISSNTYRTFNYYKDSFIKIDLTGYNKNQLLSYNLVDYNDDYGRFAIYLTNNNRALTKEEFIRNKHNLLVYNFNGYDKKGFVLEKGKVYYLHFTNYSDLEKDSYYSDNDYYMLLSQLKLTPIDESIMNVGLQNVFSGTYNIVNEREEKYTYPKRTSEEPTIIDNDSIYGFEYNNETGMYDALNTEVPSAAIKTFKIDLTESSEDKLYSLQTNGGGFHNYYTYSDDENLSTLDINKYISNIYNDDIPENYYSIDRDSSILLEKGKIHYIQVVTLKRDNDTQPFSLKITEVNSSNPSENYNTINEIREFNEKVDTVQLLKDVVTNETINVDYSEEVVLDINGYTLSSNDDYIIENSGNLTLSDTKYTNEIASYRNDLAEYREYAGLCDGCPPSGEYLLDHSLSTSFDYSGDVQEFTATETGEYKIEAWGAQGGSNPVNSNIKGGYGAYSTGVIELQAGDKLYVYVGGAGSDGNKGQGGDGGYNGGGAGGSSYRPTSSSYPGGGGGGGASHVAKVTGELPTLESNKGTLSDDESYYISNDIVIVAGGGGGAGPTGTGANDSKPGGSGGGSKGSNGVTVGTTLQAIGATQISGNSFGQGAEGRTGTSVGSTGNKGAGGGGGGFFGGQAQSSVGSNTNSSGAGGSGYIAYSGLSNKKMVMFSEDNSYESTNENTKTEITTNHSSIPVADYAKEGNGYVKISRNLTAEEIEELYNGLPRRYSVKEEPTNNVTKNWISNNNGIGIIKNNENAMLYLNDINLSVSSNYGIYNEGLVQIDAETNINVNEEKSTGIANYSDGDIVNNGEFTISVEPGCSYRNVVAATGISYSGGEHNLSNVTITGKNGIGILVDTPAKVNLHSSSINVNANSCSNYVEVSNYYDNYNKTDSSNSDLYDKEYLYYYDYSLPSNYFSSLFDRLSGSIINKGNANVDSGTDLVGKIENYGKLNISDGTSFNEIYQADKYVTGPYNVITREFENPNTSISNTIANINQIVNRAGTININEESGEDSSITSSDKPTILNFGTVNTNGGNISSVFNMGLLNSNNTDYNKIFNLHTYYWLYNDYYYLSMGYTSSEDLKGIANINGGTISTDTIVNENKMTLDNTTVQKGIINRGDLTVKGNSNVVGDNKSAILNYPFKLSNDGTVYRFSRTSLTLGDKDNEATEGPIISSTNGSYAITGDCNPKGSTPVNGFTLSLEYDPYSKSTYFKYTEDDAQDGSKTYINSNGLLTDGGGYLKDKVKYPENADNLCSINYYDGKIQNTTVTDITDVVDIPIDEVRNGYDILYSNSDLTGKVSIAPIDSSVRSDLIDVNGTSYKSLETAINNAPNNSIISISGNYDSANKVVIPSNKTLTINYLNGSKVNSYSKDALITNNGSLTISGDGTNNVVGITAYENNNNMIINGVNNTDNVGNYDSQSNLVKNNKNLTIDNVTSNGLDIVTIGDENTLTINDGSFSSNTIFGKDAEISVTGGYFDTDTNPYYYETTFDFNMQQSVSHYKPLFNIEDSVVNINNFDTDNDSRYNSITHEQNLGTFTSGSTLNLTNSKFGGKSSKEDIYASITGGSTINIDEGTYDNLLINLKDSDNTYNQTAGTLNGSLLVSGYYNSDTIYQGYRNNINITGGKINSSKDAAILLLNDSDSVITVGTKGDTNPQTGELKVSKTNPEIKGTNYGLVQGGTYSIPNKLYFYDGIFKAGGNPIDFHIEEVETGYDVVFNRNKNPKEKYLDVLPVIYNKTIDKYYYDVQESFDEANTNDELIWIKDYTNYSYSPSLVVDSSKKFKLYLSYLKSSHSVVNQGDTEYVDDYNKYDGTVEPTADETIGASYITINNRDVTDPNTGEIEEVPFIINNGDLTIIAAAVTSSGNGGDIVVDSNFESVSGATIVKNNGTLNLNGVTSINIKALGTMYENNGTMNITKSNFHTLQSNILTNNGDLSLTGSGDSSCYIPSKMKVYINDALIDAFATAREHGIDPRSFLKESIINNTGATMDIEYLNYDSDYNFVSILNNGTMNINSTTIEQYRNDDVSSTEALDNSIINNGAMTANSVYTYSAKGILNNDTLSYSGIIDAGFDTAITNTGTLTFSGTMTGAGRGIYDTGNTNINGGSITTYRESYYGTGAGTTNINGYLTTYGSFTPSYEVSKTINESCVSETTEERTVSGTLNNPKVDPEQGGYGKDYPLSTGTVFVNNRTLNINGASINLDSNSLSTLVYKSDSCYKDGIKYDKCPAPYQHASRTGIGNETGREYSIGAIEAQNSNVVFNSGSANGVTNNSNTYGIYSTYSKITQSGGYISSMYVNNSVQDVTLGTKDGNPMDSGLYLGKTSCTSDFKGINYYSGNLVLDPDNLCHILDGEDNFIIFNPSANYLIANASIIVNLDTSTPYTSIQTAVSEASSGDRLQFLYTTSLPLDDYDVNIDKNITIDTNGKVIDANFNITSGTTTITDSTNSTGQIFKVTNTSGTLDVQSGKINLIDNKSTSNITGGNIIKIVNSGTINIPNQIGKIDEITNSGTLNISGNSHKNIKKIDTTGSVIATNTDINNSIINVSQSGSLSIEGTKVKEIITNDNSTVTSDVDTIVTLLTNNNPEATPLTLGTGRIDTLQNNGYLVINGTNIPGTLSNKKDLTINSGTINELENEGRGIGNAGKYVINNANISTIIDDGTGTNYIYNGIYGSVSSTYQSRLIIEGGEFQYISNTNGKLTFGKNDSTVNTNSPRVANLNANSYAISSPSNNAINFYDGTFTSTKPIVIDATIGVIPEGYEIYTSPDYDEHGDLTGTYSMTLREKTAGETKIACVEGICYSTLQEAIDASVRNYSEIDGCPEVRIGDEFYFTVELDQDLVLDPQYQLTINLNSHNINDNGYNIPENITLINGSRNGTNLESSLSRFLANVFDNNNSSKDIIITNMSDGNALDSAKTYKLYSYNNGVYKPVKVISDGAGKYKIGNETLELKSIKGRIYINDLSAGEYMLKDNLDNELEFTIYNDGTISPNIKENITSNYGRVSASAVATLIVTIQTGIFRNKYILIGITIIVLAIIGLLLVRKNKSMKETI